MGLLLDVKDFKCGLVAAIGGEFGLVSPKTVADFSEPKSSSYDNGAENWGSGMGLHVWWSNLVLGRKLGVN